MANPTWPATLPAFINTQGHQEQWGNNSLRTQMDAGEAKQRRRFTKDIRPIDIVIEMTKAEAVIFEDFYKNTLADGSLRFAWVLPRTQAAVAFRFINPVQLAPQPGAKLWLLTAKVEQL